MTDIASIADVANTAVTAPDTLSHADIVRLGSWYIDHDEHVAAHLKGTRFAQRIPDRGGASPSERIASQAPGVTMALPEAEKTS